METQTNNDLDLPDNWILLSTVKKGENFTVKKISDKDMRTQMLRFGVAEGTTASCFERLPFGPIVIKHQRQEIAIGKELSKKIWVERLV